MKDIKYILNDCLNKAMCQKERIQKPNSNRIAEFVDKYLKTTTPLSCKNDTNKMPLEYCQESVELDGGIRYCTICGKDL